MWNPGTIVLRSFVSLFLLPLMLGGVACSGAHGQVPPFAGQSQVVTATGKQTAVFAGGCFRGVDGPLYINLPQQLQPKLNLPRRCGRRRDYTGRRGDS